MIFAPRNGNKIFNLIPLWPTPVFYQPFLHNLPSSVYDFPSSSPFFFLSWASLNSNENKTLSTPLIILVLRVQRKAGSKKERK